MEWKCSSFPSLPGTENTNWDTAAVYMRVSEYSIRKETGRFNTPLECWGCTNSPRYHADRFHTYRNCPNKRDPDVSERWKQSIQEYSQRTPIMGGSRGDQDRQEKSGKTSSMAVRSMFSERRVQLTQSWKEEGFGSLDYALLIFKIMDPSKYSSVWLSCLVSLKRKY